jgi:excisionase family DNA binding protein
MIERLNRAEAAKYCGVSVIAIDRALAGRKIRHFRVGRRVIFSREHLDEFLKSCEQIPVRRSEEA